MLAFFITSETKNGFDLIGYLICSLIPDDTNYKVLTRQFVFHWMDQALDPANQHQVQGQKSDYRHWRHYTNDSPMYHSHM